GLRFLRAVWVLAIPSAWGVAPSRLERSLDLTQKGGGCCPFPSGPSPLEPVRKTCGRPTHYRDIRVTVLDQLVKPRFGSLAICFAQAGVDFFQMYLDYPLNRRRYRRRMAAASVG